MYLVANFINQIKVNSLNKKSFFDVNYSKLILDVCVILLNDGFIKNFMYMENINKIRVYINYYNNKPLMVNSYVYSKPGFRRYLSIKEILKIFNFSKYAVISTPNGLISSHYLLSLYYKNFNLTKHRFINKKSVVVSDSLDLYQYYLGNLKYSFKINSLNQALLIN